MNNDHADLRRLAAAATPGAWVISSHGIVALLDELDAKDEALRAADALRQFLHLSDEPFVETWIHLSRAQQLRDEASAIEAKDEALRAYDAARAKTVTP